MVVNENVVDACLIVRRSLTSEWRQLKEEEASSCSPKQNLLSTNTLDDHTLVLLKCMVHKLVFMDLISLNTYFNPR